MSELIRTLIGRQNRRAASPPPMQHSPADPPETDELDYAVNAGMHRSPPPPTPWPTDGHDYTQNFGDQVAPGAAMNIPVYRTSPFDESLTTMPPKAPPEPPVPYVGQYRGRH